MGTPVNFFNDLLRKLHIKIERVKIGTETYVNNKGATAQRSVYAYKISDKQTLTKISNDLAVNFKFGIPFKLTNAIKELGIDLDKCVFKDANLNNKTYEKLSEINCDLLKNSFLIMGNYCSKDYSKIMSVARLLFNDNQYSAFVVTAHNTIICSIAEHVTKTRESFSIKDIEQLLKSKSMSSDKIINSMIGYLLDNESIVQNGNRYIVKYAMAS
jgi:hypothetical protein